MYIQPQVSLDLQGQVPLTVGTHMSYSYKLSILNSHKGIMLNSFRAPPRKMTERALSLCLPTHADLESSISV